NSRLPTHTSALTFDLKRTRNKSTASSHLISPILHNLDYLLLVLTPPSFLSVPFPTPSFFSLLSISNCPTSPWSYLTLGL
ncbi:unnamed protein product, partial [Hymenolepis diminuta]